MDPIATTAGRLHLSDVGDDGRRHELVAALLAVMMLVAVAPIRHPALMAMKRVSAVLLVLLAQVGELNGTPTGHDLGGLGGSVLGHALAARLGAGMGFPSPAGATPWGAPVAVSAAFRSRILGRRPQRVSRNLITASTLRLSLCTSARSSLVRMLR